MSPWHAALLAVVLSPLLAACPPVPEGKAPGGTAGGDRAMTTHGLEIESIEPDHRIHLAGGLVIVGDARLTEAVRAGGVRRSAT